MRWCLEKPGDMTLKCADQGTVFCRDQEREGSLGPRAVSQTPSIGQTMRPLRILPLLSSIFVVKLLKSWRFNQAEL